VAVKSGGVAITGFLLQRAVLIGETVMFVANPPL
jgi:hypothetical protein